MADSKWGGIQRIADEISSEWTERGAAYTFAEAAEVVLRRRVEPMLEAAEIFMDERPYSIRNSESGEALRKELATWQSK